MPTEVALLRQGLMLLAKTLIRMRALSYAA
jgi:hypothetical protein